MYDIKSGLYLENPITTESVDPYSQFFETSFIRKIKVTSTVLSLHYTRAGILVF